MLEVTITHRIGALHLDVACTFGSGLTAVVGPSGAGKTTLLRLIAGVLRPDAGRMQMGDTVLADVARGVWCPPHARRVGYVAQEPRLFPHFSVRNNLRYGAWFAPRCDTPAPWDDVVGLLDLAPLLHRASASLSGGEQQRVALGRALLGRPRLLLLDEPLASVDVARREEILPYLDRVRVEQRIPMIHVTHTHAEVASRADAMLEMTAGRITVPGPPV